MKSSDVRKIRTHTGMSQSVFCETFKLNLFTFRQWERKKTSLDTTATAYMTCISKSPDIISKLLNDTKKK